ncbi:MAG: lysylphosphatidylglycerol synthase domain-containing protein [Gemmatimonadota bacterium]|jgi:uncharacterized membrane protein YbhN (UPF0104 family)
MSPGGRGRLVRRGLGALLVAATLLFLALAIGRNWNQISSYAWRIRPVELAASVLLLIGALAWGIFVWHRVLHRYEAPGLRFRSLLWVWFLSNLARYVPGKIWQFVGAVQLGRRAGVAPDVLLTSMLIHAGLTVVSAAMVSLLALPTLFDELGPVAAGAVVAAGVGGLGLVHPGVLNWALRRVPSKLSTEGLTWNGSWWDGIVLLAMAVVAWLIYGAAFAVFADSIVGIPWSAVPALVAANAFAFLVGYLLFTPGGLGTREATLALMVGPVGSLGVAALVAVGFRLWLILAEVAGAALAAAIPGAALPANPSGRHGRAR